MKEALTSPKRRKRTDTSALTGTKRGTKTRRKRTCCADESKKSGRKKKKTVENLNADTGKLKPKPKTAAKDLALPSSIHPSSARVLVDGSSTTSSTRAHALRCVCCCHVLREAMLFLPPFKLESSIRPRNGRL